MGSLLFVSERLNKSVLYPGKSSPEETLLKDKWVHSSLSHHGHTHNDVDNMNYDMNLGTLLPILQIIEYSVTYVTDCQEGEGKRGSACFYLLLWLRFNRGSHKSAPPTQRRERVRAGPGV